MKIIRSFSITAILASCILSAQSVPHVKDIGSAVEIASVDVFRVDPDQNHLKTANLFNDLRKRHFGDAAHLDSSDHHSKVSTATSTLIHDQKTGLILLNNVRNNRLPTDSYGEPLESDALAVARRFLQEELKLSEGDYFLDGMSKHMLRRPNGVETVEDTCFDFRRVVNGLKCYGPGTTASIQVGRELTINYVRFDWPILSSYSAVIRRPMNEVMAALPKEIQEPDRLKVGARPGTPAAMMVYWTHEALDGSLEFVPALAVRGKALANPVPGQPRYEPNFIPLVECDSK